MLKSKAVFQKLPTPKKEWWEDDSDEEELPPPPYQCNNPTIESVSTYDKALIDVFEQISFHEGDKPSKAKEAQREESFGVVDEMEPTSKRNNTAPDLLIDLGMDDPTPQIANPFFEETKTTSVSPSAKTSHHQHHPIRNNPLPSKPLPAKSLPSDAFLGAFAEPADDHKETVDSTIAHKKQKEKEKAKKKKQKNKKNGKKAKEESEMYHSDPLDVTHSKKGTGKVKNGRIKMVEDNNKSFEEEDEELNQILAEEAEIAMEKPSVAAVAVGTIVGAATHALPGGPVHVPAYENSYSNRNYAGSDIVAWWAEEDPLRDEKRTTRNRADSSEAPPSPDMGKRSARKRSLSLPLVSRNNQVSPIKLQQQQQETIKKKDKNKEEKKKDKEEKKRMKEMKKAEKAKRAEIKKKDKEDKIKDKKLLAQTQAQYPDDGIMF
jgi:hypothetical protein